VKFLFKTLMILIIPKNLELKVVLNSEKRITPRHTIVSQKLLWYIKLIFTNNNYNFDILNRSSIINCKFINIFIFKLYFYEFLNILYKLFNITKKKCNDVALTAVNYVNRSICNYKLSKYDSTLNDSKAALAIDPKCISAYERMVKKNMKLNKIYLMLTLIVFFFFFFFKEL